MITTIEYAWAKARKCPHFLYCSVLIYRQLRLLCCQMEKQHFGIYEEAGFKVGIEWTESLGFDQERQ